MAALAGRWGAPTISGPRVIELDGVEFGVPIDVPVKIVSASNNIHVAHVKIGPRVIVLSAHGQLVEDDAAARHRALKEPWRSIRATP